MARPKGYPKSGGRQKGTPNKHKPFRAMLDALLAEIEARKGERGIPNDLRLAAL